MLQKFCFSFKLKYQIYSLKSLSRFRDDLAQNFKIEMNSRWFDVIYKQAEVESSNIPTPIHTFLTFIAASGQPSHFGHGFDTKNIEALFHNDGGGFA